LAGIGISPSSGSTPPVPGNTISNNTLDNDAVGLLLNNSGSNNLFASEHFFSNGYDLLLNESNSTTLNATNLIFDSPSGSFQNYTNLSINDNLAAGEAYSINWTANTSALPAGYISFAGNFVNISHFSGNMSIVSIAWSWTSTEAAGYTPSAFSLWNYNSTGWSSLNNTPNTVSNQLSLANLTSTGVFGILQSSGSIASCSVITSSKSLSGNLTGAPISAAPLSGTACMVIAASNVNLNCNGSSITNNGTTGNTSGILINSSYTNVTVQNCGNLSGYTNGILDYQAANGSIVNDTAYNDTYGIYLNSSANYDNLTNDTSYNNSQDGFYLSNANHTDLFNDSAYNNSYGAYLASSSSDNFTNNSFTNNSVAGLYIDLNSASMNALSNRFCYNTLDLQSLGTESSATSNACNSFSGWNESSHFGCTFTCSSMWDRFFGNINGTIILAATGTTPYIYSWNSSNGLNVYFVNSSATVHWNQLQAIGKNSSGGNSTASDFSNLDAFFGTSSFGDNINRTYSTNGSAPITTLNFTVFGKNITYVPVANSTATNTTFRTGILWDAGDGGTQYGNTVNQTTVWVVKVNTGASDVYGTYNYLGQVPYDLGTTTVAIYVELH
jgi:hypothetical protein